VSSLLQVYREASRRAVPIEVMLEITHHCSFRCQHCYIPDFTAPDQLSTTRVLALLEELAAMGTLVLALSGGEPTLRRDWQEIAREARRLGFDLHVFTNGFHLDDAAITTLAALPAAVHVSFYSHQAATFDAITTRPGSYVRVRDAVERLRVHDVRVLLKTPLMTLNHTHVDGVRAFAAAIGAESRVSPLITAKKDGDRSPLGLRVPLATLHAELGGPLLGCHPKDLDGPLCAAASRYCCITSAGDVMACNILPGSGGNVRERPFREVWEGSPWLQEIRGIRAEHLHTCRECTRLARCGRCHAQALVEDGDLYGPSSYARERADLLAAMGGVVGEGDPEQAPLAARVR
jgi:radical SAM protein with 4Fe4S-binding SPASM domain